jgi:hypothetical protein
MNPQVVLETVDIGPPYTLDGIFGTFETGFRKVQSSPQYIALTEQGERPKIVVILDALASNPGLLMPWERVVEFCKGHENAWTLVDAAHAIGQIVGINLSRTLPDFWISVGSILAIRIAGAELHLSDRTAINGYMQNELVRFFMSLEGESFVVVLSKQT